MKISEVLSDTSMNESLDAIKAAHKVSSYAHGLAIAHLQSHLKENKITKGPMHKILSQAIKMHMDHKAHHDSLS